MKYIHDDEFEGFVSDEESSPITELKIELYIDKPYVIDSLLKNTALPIIIYSSPSVPHPLHWHITELSATEEDLDGDKSLLALVRGRDLIKQLNLDGDLCSFKIFGIRTSPFLKINEVHYGPDPVFKGGWGLNKASRISEMYIWIDDIGIQRKEDKDMSNVKPICQKCKCLINEETGGFNHELGICGNCMAHSEYIDGKKVAIDVEVDDLLYKSIQETSFKEQCDIVESKIKCCGEHRTLYTLGPVNNGHSVTGTWGCKNCFQLSEVVLSITELKLLINVLI